MRTMRTLVMALALAVGVAGCAARAHVLADGQGGYTLLTTADTVEETLAPLERSARDLCGRTYELGVPEIVDRGAHSNALGVAWTEVTVRAPLHCR